MHTQSKGETTRDREFLQSVGEEIDRSRIKYPERGIHRFVAFAGEAGEALQAWAKHLIYRNRESWDHLVLELRQTAAMATRLAVEGDQTGWKPCESGLKHISECVPPALQDDPIDKLHQELETYRSLGTPKEIRAWLDKKEEMGRFIKDSLAIMELNSQCTEGEMDRRYKAEDRLAKALEALEDIRAQLSGHPEAEKGDKKVHFCLRRAMGALEAQDEAPIGIRRVAQERDEALAAAGWLADVIINDHGGSATSSAWIARGKRLFRDAQVSVQRHRTLFGLAKQEVEKQAYGCQDACPECGGTRKAHKPECGLDHVITALWQASIEPKN